MRHIPSKRSLSLNHDAISQWFVQSTNRIQEVEREDEEELRRIQIAAEEEEEAAQLSLTRSAKAKGE